MKAAMKKFRILFLLVLVMSALMVPAFADAPAAADAGAEVVEVQESDPIGSKAISAAIVVGLGAAAGAIAMGMAISKSVDSMARQPEVEGKIRTSLMLGLVFIETAIIYALIVAILIIFVL